MSEGEKNYRPTPVRKADIVAFQLEEK